VRLALALRRTVVRVMGVRDREGGWPPPRPRQAGVHRGPGKGRPEAGGRA